MSRRANPPPANSLYTVRVMDDSMFSPGLQPWFPPGCHVLIDPGRTPQNGDIVLAELRNNTEIIRKLVIDNDRFFLHSLNPNYSDESCSQDYDICGVAIDVEFKLNKCISNTRQSSKTQ